MQYELILTGKFNKSLKLARKRGLDISLLEDIVTMLQNNIPLEEKYMISFLPIPKENCMHCFW